MSCSPFIAIAVLLIALAAGFFLLIKVKKESLGMLYKLAAWLIIVVSIIGMLCCGMHCIRKCCKKNRGCGKQAQCELNQQECTHEGMQGGKCCMMKGHGSMGEGECEHASKACCKKDSAHCEIKQETDTIATKH